jgi:sugar phosphate isomerase/epimerase
MEHSPLYAVNAWSTPHNSVLDDIEQVARTGGRGLGLFEGKFDGTSDDEVKEAMKRHGLKATFCVPRTWTILPVPFNTTGMERDPAARTELICDSVRRLAAFDPEVIVVGPGVSGDRSRPAGPVAAVHEGLGRVADVAAEHGQRIGFELLAERRGSPLHNLPDVVAFIDDVGRDNIGVMFDVYHSWCEPNLHERLRRYTPRINSVHINDVQVEERSSFDRALPGDGRGVAPTIMATLIEAGYDGWWELEVFSDDGTFGNAFPDSLWKLPHEVLLERGKAAFDRAYAEALAIVDRRAGVAEHG